MTHPSEAFAPVSAQEWLTRLEKDLKGKPLHELDWNVEENIAMKPFYVDGASARPAMATHRDNTWAICEKVVVSDPKAANEQIMSALMGGAEALHLVMEHVCEADLNSTLNGVMLEIIELHFSVKPEAINELSLWLNGYCMAQKIEPSSLKGSIAIADSTQAMEFAQLFEGFKTIKLSSELENGSPSHQIASLLEQARDCMSSSDEASWAQTANAMFLDVEVGVDYLVEIGKLRALKRCFAAFFKAYNLETASVYTHVSTHNHSAEPNQNMIAAGMQALSAVIGGCDSLTVTPSDEAGTLFSRRIARNVQNLLQLEVFMGRVQDPAAGAWFIEELTDKLADEAWKAFVKS